MSGAVDGAIGGAASALVAPVVRDALYNNMQTVTTVANADGSTTQITSYNNANLNAATTAIAALAGGGAAGLLGQNSTAGVTWAENEAINNADGTRSTWKPPQEPGLVGVYPEAAVIPIVKLAVTILGSLPAANSGTTTVTATEIPEILEQYTTPYKDLGTTASVNSEAELNTLFEKLTEGGSVPVVKQYGTEVTLTDGTTVTLRGSSNSGGATIDINYKASLGSGARGNFKVHINQ